VLVPPRKDAVLSPTATTSPTQRDQPLLEIERVGRFAWKRASDFYDQAHAENAFSRCKWIVGGTLRVKRDEAQELEATLACQVLNRMRELGSASVLSGQLKEAFMGAVRGLLDLCNKACQMRCAEQHIRPYPAKGSSCGRATGQQAVRDIVPLGFPLKMRECMPITQQK
jgi:hypothetical protein